MQNFIQLLLSKWHFNASSFYFYSRGCHLQLQKKMCGWPLKETLFVHQNGSPKKATLNCGSHLWPFCTWHLKGGSSPMKLTLKWGGQLGRAWLQPPSSLICPGKGRHDVSSQATVSRLTDQDWTGRQACPLHEPRRRCAERGPYFLPVHTSIIDLLPGVTEPTKDPSDRTPLYVPQK